MKARIWKKEQLIGLAVATFFLLISNSDTVFSWERLIYDWSLPAHSRSAGNEIAIIAIDTPSMQGLRYWPWSRRALARVIGQVSRGGAKVIALNSLLSELQPNPGLLQVQKLNDYVDRSPLSQPQLPSELGTSVIGLRQQLQDAMTALNDDQLLAHSINESGNVLLGVAPANRVHNDKITEDRLTRPLLDASLDNIVVASGWTDDTLQALHSMALQSPASEFANAAAAVGPFILPTVSDDTLWKTPLIVRYQDKVLPSLPLLIAARSNNRAPEDITVHLGKGVQLGHRFIPTNAELEMQALFSGSYSEIHPFTVDSVWDVLSGAVPPTAYRSKIVLIGPIGGSAIGLDAGVTRTVNDAIPPIFLLGHSVASLLNQQALYTPNWGHGIEMILFLGVSVYLILILPVLQTRQALLVTSLLLLGLFCIEISVLFSQSVWLRLMLPAVMLVCGYLLLIAAGNVTIRWWGGQAPNGRASRNNLILGLTYQRQGQLELAFERFLGCPPSDALMEALYSLGLAYEDNNNAEKATTVYRYIETFNDNFRDIQERLSRPPGLPQLPGLMDSISETTFMGRPNFTNTGTDTGKNMKLGRYEVIRELAKGSMGVMYLGRDPTIDRIVAIKTLAFEEEFDRDEIDEVRARFFREARTAGRLTHPNIVTIFDAGEEESLAYIAMEYLAGFDLRTHTKAQQLLPTSIVMGIIYKAAKALDYAHQQNVVHRDIKPANIMFNPKLKQVKVTDFGIARITDSSRTKTGLVLGTPSYMSPEQLAGKKVDGRSDLFSLGVMLSQLCTGQLPFQSDSMSTLMYKITNDPHDNIFDIKPDLSELCPSLASVIDRALEKNMSKRYQRGLEFAEALLACHKQLLAHS